MEQRRAFSERPIVKDIRLFQALAILATVAAGTAVARDSAIRFSQANFVCLSNLMAFGLSAIGWRGVCFGRRSREAPTRADALGTGGLSPSLFTVRFSDLSNPGARVKSGSTSTHTRSNSKEESTRNK